jgi:uncharacterized protein YbcC (UPF0753/DUF2309 family)
MKAKISELTAVEAMVDNAAKFLAPVWPLETFIACNPLNGLEDLPFEQALSEGARLYGDVNANAKLNNINREMIKWCAAFLDLGQAKIAMPRRSLGMYASFRALCLYDKNLHQGLAKHKAWLASLPSDPIDAINVCFSLLQVPLNKQEGFIRELLSHLPGFAGYIKWRSVWRTPGTSPDKTPVTLVEFVAMRLVITTLLWSEVFHETSSSAHETSSLPQDTSALSQDTSSLSQDTSSLSQDTSSLSQDTSSLSQDTSSLFQDTSSLSQDTSSLFQDTSSLSQDTSSISQDTSSRPQDTSSRGLTAGSINPTDALLQKITAAEDGYRQQLLQKLLQQEKMQEDAKKTYDVQMVFCIDVRSEPIRRCIESLGNYETFGFAGFFGLPVRVHDYNTGKAYDSCPVLLKPNHDIHEVPADAHLSCVHKHKRGKEKLQMFKQAYRDLKYNFSTPFALVETLGIWCGALMLGRTVAPTLTNTALNYVGEKIQPTLDTKPLLSGITDAQQVAYAEGILRMIGITDNFAKIVIFSGHGSTTQNNPYASALDCGACGGNHGGSNAKILAAILNSTSVRAALVERGIVIPSDTCFKAAEHNTTTDEITIYQDESSLHLDIMQSLQKNLVEAREINSQNRCQAFALSATDGSSSITTQRSNDWSEVRPEWGLARNAAFIIGPRSKTCAVSLEGRCFLHSYQWQEDNDDSILETILTAPMVVAEWINTQYLFSTIDNIVYGAGSKITHNVTGKLGIMQGNGSDLMHGLPLQSVMSADHEPYHQAQRLLTVVYAPRTKLDIIIKRQEVLQKLFFNGWVMLMAIDPQDNLPYLLDRQGNWQVA